jgi:uridine kinase
MVQYIEQKLVEKSTHHRAALTKLELSLGGSPLSNRVVVLPETTQLKGMNTIIQDIDTLSEDFIFYFDRLACLLIEQYAKLSLLFAAQWFAANFTPGL